MPGAEQEASGQLPVFGQHLQPEDRLAELKQILTALVNDVEQDADLNQEEREEADGACQRLERLGGDQRLHEQLAEAGFAGPAYEVFRSELAAYALPVLRSWIRRKLIYGYCQSIGRPVKYNSEEAREHLARDYDDRLELALETAASALRLFHRVALVGGRWSAAGGASLTTYFVGACLRTFPAVYRKWARERDRAQPAFGTNVEDDAPHTSRLLHPPTADDPAAVVVGQQTVTDELAKMDPKTREAAARVVLDAATFEEAGKPLGLTARGVEGRLYRYRTEVKRRTGKSGSS